MTAIDQIKLYLFPIESRRFPGLRWTNILLRTFHLIGVSGVGAAFLYKIPAAQCYPYLLLTIYSGVLMMLLAIWSNGIWLVQLRGIATLLKLVLLVIASSHHWDSIYLFSIILIAGIISHAPAKFRYFMIIPQSEIG